VSLVRGIKRRELAMEEVLKFVEQAAANTPLRRGADLKQHS
jgi:hypothetical protein